MRYLPAIVFICLIFSCSGKKTEHGEQNKPQVITNSTPEKATESQTKVVESSKKQQNDSIPEFAVKTIASLSGQYLIDTKDFIRGDFNADNQDDFSARLTNLKNKKKGVIIIHNSDKIDYYFFGAGKVVDGMDNLDWINEFRSILKGDTVAATLVDEESGDIIGADKKNAVQLKGNGIFMHVDESEGGGIIYWNGRKYEWLHIE